jgi:hypothetical protein
MIYLGLFLVALPFIFLFVAIWYCEGVGVAISIYAIVMAVISIMLIGIEIVNNNI